MSRGQVGKDEVEEEADGMHNASEAPKGLQILSWCKVKPTRRHALRSHNPIHCDKEQSGCLETVDWMRLWNGIKGIRELQRSSRER